MTRIKICGCTSYEDAAGALEAGADAIGFIFGASERKVSPADVAAILPRLAPFGTVFGVFSDPEAAEVESVLGLIPGLYLQFSGEEPPALCEGLSERRPYLKAFHLGGERGQREVVASIGPYRHALPLFDTWDPARRGGTGRPFSWSSLANVEKPSPFAVSGGLTPENVGECVRLLRPNLVDVRTGVERDGRKDHQKMRAFVRAVREADAQA